MSITATAIASAIIFFFLVWLNGIIQGTLLSIITPEDLTNPGQSGIVIGAIPHLISFFIYYFGVNICSVIKRFLDKLIVYKKTKVTKASTDTKYD